MVASFLRQRLARCRNLNMTGATGKGICMFANKNTHNLIIGLLGFVVLLCPFSGSAQEPAIDSESQQAESNLKEAPEQNRRIDRLGDTDTDEWEMDLSMPAAAPGAASGNADALPDEAQNELRALIDYADSLHVVQ